METNDYEYQFILLSTKYSNGNFSDLSICYYHLVHIILRTYYVFNINFKLFRSKIGIRPTLMQHNLTYTFFY